MALSYRPLAIALHWLSAAAVIALIALGLWMTGLPIGLPKVVAYAWHKWIGITVLLLSLLRLFVRWRWPPPALPAPLAAWERRLAPAAHWMLLALLLALPISGWLMSSAGGVSVVWFAVLPLPDLVPRDRELFAALRTTHHLLARLLIAAIVLHLAAVVWHDVVHRHGIFKRMWPL